MKIGAKKKIVLVLIALLFLTMTNIPAGAMSCCDGDCCCKNGCDCVKPSEDGSSSSGAAVQKNPLPQNLSGAALQSYELIIYDYLENIQELKKLLNKSNTLLILSTIVMLN